MTQIGFLLFPKLTQLDLTAPWEVLSGGPDATCHLVWKTREVVLADSGLPLLATATFDDVPQLDVLVVPGGTCGVTAVLGDPAVLAWVRGQGEGARYVTSVCTGALILGAAGLLRGYRATTHWSTTERLAEYGATFEPGRVVRDRNRLTGGGVTAGIDFGLTLASELWGDSVAMAIQLALEYDPHPPLHAGSPARAPASVLANVKARLAESW